MSFSSAPTGRSSLKSTNSQRTICSCSFFGTDGSPSPTQTRPALPVSLSGHTKLIEPSFDVDPPVGSLDDRALVSAPLQDGRIAELSGGSEGSRLAGGVIPNVTAPENREHHTFQLSPLILLYPVPCWANLPRCTTLPDHCLSQPQPQRSGVTPTATPVASAIPHCG